MPFDNLRNHAQAVIQVVAGNSHTFSQHPVSARAVVEADPPGSGSWWTFVGRNLELDPVAMEIGGVVRVHCAP
jgi:hypothetical protein